MTAFESKWCEDAKRPATILIVDDNAEDRMLFREATREFHCEILEANDGRSALEMAQDHPDLRLIVLDESMPRMNGIEVFRRLRSSGSRARVIFLTGHVRELIEEVSGIGFATILSKTALVKGTTLTEMMSTMGFNTLKACC